MKNRIMALIDGSPLSASVCSAGTWASLRLKAPLCLLHVLEKLSSPAMDDLSGAIGIDAREQLLIELTAVDERRMKLALQHGKLLLEDAKKAAEEAGAHDVSCKQQHGQLVESLLDLEGMTRLFVMGKVGMSLRQSQGFSVIGSHVESAVRSIHTPVLVAPENFEPPERYMLAYDGSPTADRALERIAMSPLLRGLEGHIVTVTEKAGDDPFKMEGALAILKNQGHSVKAHVIEGQVVEALENFRNLNRINLQVMGAYGHSRIREFFLGSNTTKMIGRSHIPLLLLR